MSATDFLPRREADLATFSTNLNNRVNADPLSLGVPVSLAASYNEKHSRFMALYALATVSGTRTPSGVRAKNEAQKILRKAARQIVGIIQSKSRVTNEQKKALGLTINRPGGNQPPIGKPTSAPGVTIVSQDGNRVKVRLRNLAERSRTGRPTGVRSATIWRHIGDEPPTNIKEWKIWKNVTRTVNTLLLPPDVPPGTKVWVTAQWRNPRLEPGPVARPMLIYTQFGAAPVQRQLKLAA